MGLLEQVSKGKAAIRSTIGQVYEASGKIATLLAAPGWSEDQEVNTALKSVPASL